jgi:hypothetical protein
MARRPSAQALWDNASYRQRSKVLKSTITPWTTCWRCGKTLQEHPRHKSGRPAWWETGHLVDGDPRSPLALEASVCNRSEGGRVGGLKSQRLGEPRSPNA